LRDEAVIHHLAGNTLSIFLQDPSSSLVSIFSVALVSIELLLEIGLGTLTLTNAPRGASNVLPQIPQQFSESIELLESPVSARQSSVATSRRHPAGQRFQVHSVARENSVNNDEPGFCVHQWLREQQHQKGRLALRPEDAPPLLRMLLD
jgi:hypothetical protein